MPFLKFVNIYFRKNFFDNDEEFQYPNMSNVEVAYSSSDPLMIAPNSIGFSNKSILIFDQGENSIFTRKHNNWIERKISNSKYGQIVTLKNFTDER